MECTFPNGLTCLFASDNIQSENVVSSFFAEKSSVRPSCDHDAGTCETPGSGFCQPLRRARTISALHEDRRVAVSVGLECNELTVSRPNREAILSSKCKAA